MEILVVLAIIAIFLALFLPAPPTDPPTPGDTLMKGLLTVAKAIKVELGGGGGSKDKGGKEISPWFFVIGAIVIGLVSLYLT